MSASLYNLDITDLHLDDILNEHVSPGSVAVYVVKLPITRISNTKRGFLCANLLFPYMHIHLHTHIHTNTHTHAHTNTHTHTHTHKQTYQLLDEVIGAVMCSQTHLYTA